MMITQQMESHCSGQDDHITNVQDEQDVQLIYLLLRPGIVSIVQLLIQSRSEFLIKSYLSIMFLIHYIIDIQNHKRRGNFHFFKQI